MAKLTRQQILQIVKWGWLVLIGVVVLAYGIRNAASIRANLASVPLVAVLLSLMCVIVGKLLLAQQSRMTLTGVKEWQPDYLEMLYINSITQMGKYLPGGIWHLVGRFGFYKVRAVDLKQASTAIIVENIWLLGSAALAGILASLHTPQSWLWTMITQPPPLATIMLSVAVILVWGAMLSITLKGLTQALPIRLALILLLLQASVWTVLGAALWVLFTSTTQAITLPLAVSGFSLSYAIGYVAIFAPSGIGIREGGLVLLLGAFSTPEQILIIASLNRFVWIVAEFMLGIGSEAALARRYPFVKDTRSLSEGDNTQA